MKTIKNHPLMLSLVFLCGIISSCSFGSYKEQESTSSSKIQVAFTRDVHSIFDVTVVTLADNGLKIVSTSTTGETLLITAIPCDNKADDKHSQEVNVVIQTLNSNGMHSMISFKDNNRKLDSKLARDIVQNVKTTEF